MAERTKPEADALRGLHLAIEGQVADVGFLLKAVARLTEENSALDAEDTEMVHALIGIAYGRYSNLCDVLGREAP